MGNNYSVKGIHSSLDEAPVGLTTALTHDRHLSKLDSRHCCGKGERLRPQGAETHFNDSNITAGAVTYQTQPPFLYILSARPLHY